MNACKMSLIGDIGCPAVPRRVAYHPKRMQATVAAAISHRLFLATAGTAVSRLEVHQDGVVFQTFLFTLSGNVKGNWVSI